MHPTPGEAELRQAIEQMQLASEQMTNGDNAPWKARCSHSDDATIVGAWGGHERGWAAEVERRYDWVANRFQGGELRYENVVTLTGELAYTFGIERGTVRLAGRDEPVELALRVTHIFRREDGAWKLLHRHADPLTTTMQAVETIAGAPNPHQRD